MQSFTLFSPLTYFTSLSCNFHLCAFTSDQPHPFWLLWHYFLFSFAFLVFLVRHTFQLFLICCPLVPFHLPLAKVAKITLDRQGTENQTVVINEPSPRWLQTKTGLEDLVRLLPLLIKWKQEKAKGRAPILIISPQRYNLRFSRETAVMHTSLSV